MLGTAHIIAFAATVDSTNARAFYEGALGLRCVSDDQFALVLDANGVQLRIQKVATLAPQPHTLLGWSVPSIDSAVRQLASRGVAFERYPHFQQDRQGVWTSPSGAKVAWFKDPDGNLLSLTEPTKVELLRQQGACEE
jgi:catechol 2,3-dioxygenase-like lactoylglutathione lyase family enzyme